MIESTPTYPLLVVLGVMVGMPAVVLGALLAVLQWRRRPEWERRERRRARRRHG